MNHAGHGRTECSCGALISQCLCVSQHREVTVVQRGCQLCADLRLGQACALLRRAAKTITEYELGEGGAIGADSVLPDIGAFLARVDPR